ncbi:hypothetical protein CBL_10978 [Carabus blaptoides fortunei]
MQIKSTSRCSQRKRRRRAETILHQHMHSASCEFQRVALVERGIALLSPFVERFTGTQLFTTTLLTPAGVLLVVGNIIFKLHYHTIDIPARYTDLPGPPSSAAAGTLGRCYCVQVWSGPSTLPLLSLSTCVGHARSLVPADVQWTLSVLDLGAV